MLEIRFPPIEFTFEIENKDKVPFLKGLLIRNCTNKLGIDVFRKHTRTDRYIRINSHSSTISSFTLNSDRFDEERSIMKEVAVNNGYSYNMVDCIIKDKV